MHTKYSDGYYSVRELIEMLNDNGIKYASFTDHNSLDAHVEFERDNLSKYFNGTIIRGVEIQTLVGDFLIEVLVYNYDLNSFKAFVDKTQENFWIYHHESYKKLLKTATKMGLKYIEPDKELQNGYYCNMKFQDAIRNCYDENIKIVSDRVLTDHLY